MNKILIGTVIATLTGAGALVAVQSSRGNTLDSRIGESGGIIATPPRNSTQPVTPPYADDGGNTTGGHRTDEIIDYIGNHTPRESTQVYSDQYGSSGRNSAQTSVPTNDPIRRPGDRPGGRGSTSPVEPPVSDGSGDPPANPYPNPYPDPGNPGTPGPGNPMPDPYPNPYPDPGKPSPINPYPDSEYPPAPQLSPEGKTFGALSVNDERYVQGTKDR